MNNRTFQIALLISFIAHALIFINGAGFNIFSKEKTEEKMEISYILEPAPKKQPVKAREMQKNTPLKIPPKISPDKKIPPPFIEKDSSLARPKTEALREPLFNKPAFPKPDVIAVKKKITLPPIDIDKINNPSYLTYYQIVREKIRRAAYQSYTRTETGEVYLTFVIANNGFLKDVKLIEEKSSRDPYLKEIALKSIRDASPFPVFDKELDYPQLSFNVVISFEVE